MSSYRSLLETLDAWFALGVGLAGPGVVPCKRSCSACCHGVFDISAADALLIAEGLAALPSDVAEAVQTRAAAQLKQCAELLPTWGPPWNVDALPEGVFDALTESLSKAPCPALEDDGGCAIYAYRPATCRMTGLAMRLDDADRLDNECPIQDDFPDYAALAPVPFELMDFEDLAATHDQLATSEGSLTTTVAGAMVAGTRGDEPAPP